MCTLCTTLRVNTSHLLYKCGKIASVWAHIEQMLQDITECTVITSEENIVFGFYKEEKQLP